MNDQYLAGRVTTASQPELQLMLLESALRFGRKARELWEAPAQRVEANHLLERTIDILEELVRSVSGGKTEPSKRLEEEYAFLFRHLTGALVNQDLAILDKSLELLAFQRETWRQACEKLRPKAAPTPAPNLAFGDQPVSGFSFQA